MSRLVFDKTGEKTFETGVSDCVLYVRKDATSYDSGVAWNGVTAVNESPSGAESTPVYADNIKYLNLTSAEEFAATLEAYTYPDEFEVCDGSAEVATGVTIGQQDRKQFALCYKTKVGNDVEGTAHGYKLHFIYNCQAAPSSKDYQTINGDPEAMTFSWEISTTPMPVTGYKPTATLVVDSRKVDAQKLKKLEDKIYGAEATEPTMPTVEEVIAIVTEP